MSTARRIAKNSFWALLGEIISKCLFYLTLIIIARVFGPEEFGFYSFSFAIGLFLSLAFDAGISSYYYVKVCKEKTNQLTELYNILALKLILIIITSIIVGSVLFTRGIELTKIIVMVLIFGYIILDNVSSFFQAMLSAFEKMKIKAIMLICEKSIIFVSTLVLVYVFKDLKAILVMFILAGIIRGLIGFFSIVKGFKLKFKLDFHKMIKIMGYSFPFLLVVAFNMFNNRLDSVMLSLIKGDYFTGVYNASYNLVLPLVLLSQVFVEALGPVFGKDYLQSSKYKEFMRTSIKYILLFSLPIVIILNQFSGVIITVIYGQRYIESIIPLKLLLITVVIIGITQPLKMQYLLEKKLRRLNLALIIGIICNFALNLILIPKYAHNGAAIATIISFSIIFLFLYNKEIIKIKSALVYLFAFILLIVFYKVIILQIAVYAVLLYMAITKADIKYVKEVISFKPNR